MKKNTFIFWLLLSGLIFSACGGKSIQPATSTGATNEPVQATNLPIEMESGCYTSVPKMPGSRLDTTHQANPQEVIPTLGGQQDWFPGELKVYTTSKDTEAVLEFFSTAMPENGWKKVTKIPGKNWGFMTWKMDRFQIQLLTGLSENKTYFLLGCLALEPTPTPMQAEPLTMKGAFDLLGKMSQLNDLAFYGFDAFSMKEDGLSASYTVSGYSKSAKKFCYLQADGKKVELECREQDAPEEPLVEDLNTLKDSPELMQEAFQKYAPCPNGAHMEVNLAQKEAQFMCSEKMWSGDVSPFK